LLSYLSKTSKRSVSARCALGVLIASPELSSEIAARFDALTQLDNSYAVTLSEGAKGTQHLIWSTQEAGRPVHYEVSGR